MTVKRPLRGALWITGSLIFLLVVAGLFYYRELAVAYHKARLRNDPGYVLRLAEAADDSTGEEALSAYLATAAGREHLRAFVIRQLLDHLTGPGVETTAAALDPAAWDQIELEVRRLHYEGPSEEWWVVYAARDDAGRTMTGSTRAKDVLVALERHLTQVETGEAGAVPLPDYPGMEFGLRPSEVDRGEWRVVGRRSMEGEAPASGVGRRSGVR